MIPIINTSVVKSIESISVSSFYTSYRDLLKLELVNDPAGLAKSISEPTLNRPGLALAGFFSYFANKRVQVFGAAELAYLNRLSQKDRSNCVKNVLLHDIPCIVCSRGDEVPQEVIEFANQAGVCVFRTRLVTMRFINMATYVLESEFAESTSTHGTMLDIRGVGILIRGKSGIGKSEAALGLIERGAALVADDMVRLRNINGEITAFAPPTGQGYLEIRGIGIINVSNLFGLKAIRQMKNLNLVVSLGVAAEMTDIDRLGLEAVQVDILGEKINYVELPVAPGRDIARLIEVAALGHQLKNLGYDMAGEFNRRLVRSFTPPEEKK